MTWKLSCGSGMGQMQGGGSRVMNFGKSKAKQVTKDFYSKAPSYTY